VTSAGDEVRMSVPAESVTVGKCFTTNGGHVDRCAVLVDGPIEIAPLAADLDGRLGDPD
jgi:hypothetical protein